MGAIELWEKSKAHTYLTGSAKGCNFRLVIGIKINS